jgi:hypothetical protein
LLLKRARRLGRRQPRHPRASAEKLTRKGRKQLEVEKQEWSKLTAAVRLIFSEGG